MRCFIHGLRQGPDFNHDALGQTVLYPSGGGTTLASVDGFYVMQYYSSCISCLPHRMPDETTLFKSIKATRMPLDNRKSRRIPSLVGLSSELLRKDPNKGLEISSYVWTDRQTHQARGTCQARIFQNTSHAKSRHSCPRHFPPASYAPHRPTIKTKPSSVKHPSPLRSEHTSPLAAASSSTSRTNCLSRPPGNSHPSSEGHDSQHTHTRGTKGPYSQKTSMPGPPGVVASSVLCTVDPVWWDDAGENSVGVVRLLGLGGGGGA